ncbi:RICIN domain-containing protein [Streptomyces sp. AK04-3B]|uniref:RICIN domain-containing protein n=1 Tax=unclassified Streptomyces TaxID=2593676 RepID=UPI0029B37A29|nr:RICIN domain-containing protein [Streptomyces sp. AK04-3B]MDX3802516.1 RICIN domain-containing protein [Streptomyces sp. AK04-3B]
MGRTFRMPLALAAAALLTAPLLSASSLTGTATAATAATTTAAAATTAEAAAVAADATPVYARLYNQGTGKCAAVAGGSSSTQGDYPIQWPCSTSESQYWALIAVPGGYQVKNLASGLCLAMASGTKLEGANPIQWPCNGGESAEDAEQVWAHDSIDRLRNVNSKFCLAIVGASTNDRVKPAQRTCDASKEQQWLW